MSVQPLVRLAAAGLAAILLLAAPVGGAQAQQDPSPARVALANEILDLKGSLALFEALVPGVIEKTRSTLIQVNPSLFKDLSDVATGLRKELAPRFDALRGEIAKVYASRFTEQELKDTLTFYKSPLGKKLLTEEPIFVENSMRAAEDWAVKLNEEVLQRFRAEMRKKGHSL